MRLRRHRRLLSLTDCGLPFCLTTYQLVVRACAATPSNANTSLPTVNLLLTVSIGEGQMPPPNSRSVCYALVRSECDCNLQSTGDSTFHSTSLHWLNLAELVDLTSLPATTRGGDLNPSSRPCLHPHHPRIPFSERRSPATLRHFRCMGWSHGSATVSR